MNELGRAVRLRDADLVQTVLRLLEEPNLPMQWLALPSPHTAAQAHHSQLLRPPSPPLYACWLPAPAYVYMDNARLENSSSCYQHHIAGVMVITHVQ